LRWLESVEEDIKNVGVRNWRFTSKRTQNSGGQFWKRLRFSKNCNAGRSRTGRKRRRRSK
jgi:hypothetical protein